MYDPGARRNLFRHWALQKPIALPAETTVTSALTSSLLTGHLALRGLMSAPFPFSWGLAGAFSSGIFAANSSGLPENLVLQPFQQNPIVLPL